MNKHINILLIIILLVISINCVNNNNSISPTEPIINNYKCQLTAYRKYITHFWDKDTIYDTTISVYDYMIIFNIDCDSCNKIPPIINSTDIMHPDGNIPGDSKFWYEGHFECVKKE